MVPIKQVIIVYGGELARDVAEQMEKKLTEYKKKQATTKSGGDDIIISVTLRNACDKPKNLLNLESDTIVCFIIQTIENASPTEDGGTCLRFFKRKSHPSNLLKENKFQYTVLGLGDSNLLLDRQTTTSKDCNQCAQELDLRLETLGATKFHDLGLADERTGLQEEVEPWIESFCQSLFLSK